MTSDVTVDLQDRFALAREMAIEAGAVALAHFNARERLIIETKADPHDVVSIAHREVADLIRTRIAAAFPADAILGEEYGVSSGTSDYTWVVDPIDGTSPFVNGMPTWCVSVAVLYQGVPVVGVIQAPCANELYAAALGLGASLNGATLLLDSSRTIQTAMTGIGCNTHVAPEVVGSIITALLASGGTFIRNGSGALMLAYVAA